MHHFWGRIKEVPYCFSRSSVKFQCHMGKQMPFVTRIQRFWTVTPVWIHRWLWNDARRGALLLFFRSSIKLPGHTGRKVDDLNPILSKITRPVTAMKSLRFALFIIKIYLAKLSNLMPRTNKLYLLLTIFVQPPGLGLGTSLAVCLAERHVNMEIMVKICTYCHLCKYDNPYYSFLGFHIFTLLNI